MKTLYFIRHAESVANKNRILASRMAYPLTEEGKADSLQIANEFKAITELDAIISSPLKRAVETAESFSSVYKLELELDDRLVEQDLGKFSGMSYDEVKAHADYESYSLNRWGWVPEGGGESYSMIAERVCDFMNALSEYGANSVRVLIVTHAVTLRLITAALKDTLPEYPASFPNNGEILKVEFEGLGKKYEIESIFLGNSAKFTHNP